MSHCVAECLPGSILSVAVKLKMLLSGKAEEVFFLPQHKAVIIADFFCEGRKLNRKIDQPTLCRRRPTYEEEQMPQLHQEDPSGKVYLELLLNRKYPVPTQIGQTVPIGDIHVDSTAFGIQRR